MHRSRIQSKIEYFKAGQHNYYKISPVIMFLAFSSLEEACIHCLRKKVYEHIHYHTNVAFAYPCRLRYSDRSSALSDTYSQAEL